jgi:transposase
MLKPTGWWLVAAPVDLRCGIDRLLLQVAALAGREACDGGAYVFRNRSGTRIKVLCVDAHGVWLAVRRLHDGRFLWPVAGDAAWSLTAVQFDWLVRGIDWQRMSRDKVFATRV